MLHNWPKGCGLQERCLRDLAVEREDAGGLCNRARTDFHGEAPKQQDVQSLAGQPQVGQVRQRRAEAVKDAVGLLHCHLMRRPAENLLIPVHVVQRTELVLWDGRMQDSHAQPPQNPNVQPHAAEFHSCILVGELGTAPLEERRDVRGGRGFASSCQRVLHTSPWGNARWRRGCITKCNQRRTTTPQTERALRGFTCTDNSFIGLPGIVVDPTRPGLAPTSLDWIQQKHVLPTKVLCSK